MAPTPKSNRLTTAIGRHGEQLARQYLKHKGYRFIAANWLCPQGEIDLIMQHDPTRVIVEVRLRSSADYGTGADTVTYHKQQKLIRTAKLYQQATNYWQDLRFDVISITFNADKTPQIDHIEHAFENVE